MKSKDKTKQKKHESTIGKIIYGFLLFMPLLAIGVTCAYAIFNKNAYQSYYGETINETKYTLVENITSLEVGKTYEINTSSFDIKDTTTPQGAYARFMSVENVKVLDTNVILNGTSIKSFAPYINTSSQLIIQLRFDDAPSQYINVTSNSQIFIATFTYLGNDLNYNFAYNDLFYDVEYNSISYVSEVFYYSIDKVEQSPLFNWAEDSAIYTGMTATCNALDISTTFIPLLMTYWLIISVIYFLYDIILIILHIFHRKIHELEESI